MEFNREFQQTSQREQHLHPVFGPAEQHLKPLAWSAPAALQIKCRKLLFPTAVQHTWEGILFSFHLAVTETLSGAHGAPGCAAFSPYYKALAADTQAGGGSFEKIGYFPESKIKEGWRGDTSCEAVENLPF